MQQALTDYYVKSVQPPVTGRVEIADMRCSGLALRVTAAGARSWCFRFRDPQSGRTTRATLGPYPALGLADARAAADVLRKKVVRGINPVQARRREREEAEGRTFEALSERYMTEHARRRKKPKSVEEDARNLRLHVLPAWADRPFDSIARRDVIEICERLVVAGKPVQANRVQALISSIYSFAIDADLVTANPASRLRKRGAETKRTRVLSDDELRLFWARAVLPPVSCAVGLALRLALLTGMRAGEVAGLARSEIESLDDPERAAVMLPVERVKNGRAHLVPLSPLAVETLREALALAGGGEYVFVPRGDAIKGHVLGVAMARMAAALPDEPGADTWLVNRPTPHDLRRTCATRLAALGVPGEDVSAVLNHARADITGRHYDHYARAREKRAALNAWAAALTCILEPGQGGEVVPICKGRAR
jgi:integrase